MTVSLAVWLCTVSRQEAVVLQAWEGLMLTDGVLEARPLLPSVAQIEPTSELEEGILKAEL